MPVPEPVHPGVVLRERVLEPLGLTSGRVVRAIGVLPDAVRRISPEEMHLSAKMAVQLGRCFGNGAEYWGELQLRHDHAIAGASWRGICARLSRCGERTASSLNRRRADALERAGPQARESR